MNQPPRKGTGIYDIFTRMEVLVPPSTSQTQYQHWAKTAPIDEVQRWARFLKTADLMEAIIINGEEKGLTGTSHG